MSLKDRHFQHTCTYRYIIKWKKHWNIAKASHWNPKYVPNTLLTFRQNNLISTKFSFHFENELNLMISRVCTSSMVHDAALAGTERTGSQEEKSQWNDSPEWITGFLGPQQKTHLASKRSLPSLTWNQSCTSVSQCVYLRRLTVITILLLLLSRLTLIFTPKKSSPRASPNPPSTVLMLPKAEYISSWNKTVTCVFWNLTSI